MGLVYLPTFKNHRFMANVGQYPSPMDPMGLWVIGINLAVNESTAKTLHVSHRLAGDTHLIAWPDISLLGENLRFKDTEYSEVESSETEKSRMEKMIVF